ncbi:MAG: hypothetical protein QM760_06720 [Nibricoccus sp.]
MRSIFLLGGFLGFTLVAVTGWLCDRSVDLVLRDAALGALGCALLFRWFWGMWVKAIVHMVEAKRAVAKAAAEAEAAASAKPVGAAKAR